MIVYSIPRDEVIGLSYQLPPFPAIVTQILATIENPDANLNLLVAYIQRDPILAARVLSLANSASKNRQHQVISDIPQAISMIGMGRVREMAIFSSIAGFAKGIDSQTLPMAFWEHSIAVGICCEELAHYCGMANLSETALITGLLHDVGQLWLHCFNAQDYRELWRKTLAHEISIEQAEQERFGVDHATIGAWLGEHWALPNDIVKAIRYHHIPDMALPDRMVPLVHVAEVLSNALDLMGRDENRVTHISSAACQKIGIALDDDIRSLFGRIEARSRYAISLFQ